LLNVSAELQIAAHNHSAIMRAMDEKRQRGSSIKINFLLVFPLFFLAGCIRFVQEVPEATPTSNGRMTSVENADSGENDSQRVYRDLIYGGVSQSQKLDLYLPAGQGPFPLVLIIHGGGFISGDKANTNEVERAELLVQNGFAAASANYRLSEEAVYPAQIHDTKTAVRFLRANADKYSLDPSGFGAWGSSAGGTLAALLGTTCGVEELEGAQLGYQNQSSCIRAVIDWFGLVDLLNMDVQLVEAGCEPIADDPASNESKLLGAPVQSVPELAWMTNPINYVDGRDAAFFIQHGSGDCRVPPAQSRQLADALRQTVGEEKVNFMLLEGAGHGGGEFKTDANYQMLIDFLKKHLH